MRVTIIHGFNATPESNFIPWLADSLRDRGFEVRVPELPLKTGEPIEMQELLELMEEKIGVLDQDDIVIGHSLGGVLAMRYLEYVELRSTPRAFVLVAAPWKVNHPAMKTLFMTDLDYDVIPWKAAEYFVVHSRDDEMVPFDHAEKWAEMLKANLIDKEGNDHYMGEQYPILLDLIQKINDNPLEFEPGIGLKDELESVGGEKDRE